jgi:hypothetical protein
MAAKAKAEPAKAGPILVKVTALANYQIAFEGQVAGPGGTLTVPVELADQWVASGIATR